MRIVIALDDSGVRNGERVARFDADDTDGFDPQAHKKNPKATDEGDDPNESRHNTGSRAHKDHDADKVFVSRINWNGRRTRDLPKKQRRIKAPANTKQ